MIRHSYLHSWEYAEADFAPALRMLEAGGRDLQGEVIYHTRHKECLRISGEKLGLDFDVVVKRYAEKRFWRYFLRPSLAYREYRGFRLAAEAGMPVARVLALGEKRCFTYLRESFFITRYEAGAHSGFELIGGGDPAVRDEFIRLNLSLLARLHRAGLIHGGFHSGNELYRIGADGAMSVVWIDLATVAPARECRRFTMADDVERFLRDFSLPAEAEREYRDWYATELAKREI